MWKGSQPVAHTEHEMAPEGRIRVLWTWFAPIWLVAKLAIDGSLIAAEATKRRPMALRSAALFDFGDNCLIEMKRPKSELAF